MNLVYHITNTALSLVAFVFVIKYKNVQVSGLMC